MGEREKKGDMGIEEEGGERDGARDRKRNAGGGRDEELNMYANKYREEITQTKGKATKTQRLQKTNGLIEERARKRRKARV